MSPTRRPGRLARAAARLLSDAALYVTIFMFLAVQTAAASAQHAHDALVQGGQGRPAWLPWTLAGTPELLAVLATLEYRDRRKKHGAAADVRVPLAVIVGSALVLMGAQLVTATRTALGLFTAAWPALAFLVAVALIETRPRPASAAAGRPPVASPRPPAVTVSGPTPDTTPGNPPDEAGVAALLDRCDDSARTVYAVLAAADPGATLTPAQIRQATGLDKDTAYRAVRRLVDVGLAASPQTGRYAARRIGAVA